VPCHRGHLQGARLTGCPGRSGRVGKQPPQLACAAGPRRCMAAPRMTSLALPSPPPQVIHEGADPVQVVTENMSRPLKAEVSPMVAEAAHYAEVPAAEGAPASTPGCTI
jgi:hypothetical protein